MIVLEVRGMAGERVRLPQVAGRQSSTGRRKMKRRNIMIAAGANHTLVYESITEFED